MKTALTFKEQHLHLLPERALYWQEARTAVVADIHFGKAAAFRAHGVALPAGTTRSNLERLSAVLEQTGAERLLILGDLLHARAGRTAAVIEQVARWRRQRPSLAVEMVIGNHDRHAGEPPAEWNITAVEELVEPPFVWRHHPQPSPEGYVIAGHIHPAVTLRGGGEALTLPCFYFGEAYALLPAFGAFTGFAVVRPRPGELLFVIAEDELLPIPN